MSRRIKLTQGKTALVDDDVYEELSKYKWFYAGRYPARGVTVSHKKQRNLYMHHAIMGVQKKGQEVDHIDGNGLNNQKSNLRFATHAQNGRNQRKSKVNTSGYKGVSWNKKDKKWHSQIKVNKKTIHLGSYAEKEDAYMAYCMACAKHHGEFANLGVITT